MATFRIRWKSKLISWTTHTLQSSSPSTLNSDSENETEGENSISTEDQGQSHLQGFLQMSACKTKQEKEGKLCSQLTVCEGKIQEENSGHPINKPGSQLGRLGGLQAPNALGRDLRPKFTPEQEPTEALLPSWPSEVPVQQSKARHCHGWL